jgi:glycerate kinase
MCVFENVLGGYEMKIIAAPDSFKGSLTSQQVGNAIKAGIERAARPDTEVVVVPMADGGEGTVACFAEALHGTTYKAVVTGPLGQPAAAEYAIVEGDARICVIEIAQTSGLYLIEEHSRNPLATTSYGLGQLIRAGLDQGCRSFILGLGGSATNDAGAGMLQALGFRLLDSEEKEIGCGGGSLGRLSRIDRSGSDPRLKECEFIVACDVDNPLIGKQGASAVFGPQKGATPDMVRELDANLAHFADVVEAELGLKIHDMPGAGAAGGIGGAVAAFLNGKMRSGAELLMDAVKLEAKLSGADLVITGEGRVDGQTVHGKTPFKIAKLAQQKGVPVVVIGGSIGPGAEKLYDHGISALFGIAQSPMTLEEAMRNGAELISFAAEQIFRLFRAGR